MQNIKDQEDEGVNWYSVVETHLLQEILLSRVS